MIHNGISLSKTTEACLFTVESFKTFVFAFVASRFDYCNLVLVSTPKTVTDKLQFVVHAAPRLISGTKKYN